MSQQTRFYFTPYGPTVPTNEYSGQIHQNSEIMKKFLSIFSIFFISLLENYRIGSKKCTMLKMDIKDNKKLN